MGRTCCVQKLFWMSKKISVHNKFSPGLSLEQSVIILLVSWCKNKSLWQRFTCKWKKELQISPPDTAKPLKSITFKFDSPRVLFCKIEVRPRSCWSYPQWCPCNWWEYCDHQMQLMQIIGLNIGGTLSRLKPLSKKLVKKKSTKVLAVSWYRGRLFVYFTFRIIFKRIKHEKCAGIAWDLNFYETHCTLCIHIWKFLRWKWNFLSWKNYWQALTVLSILAKNVWHGLPYPWPSYSCTTYA